MFTKHDIPPQKQLADGVQLKTLAYGDTMLSVEFRMRKGSRLPLHQHHHEQVGYLVAGKMRLTIGEEQYEVEPGDSWCVSGNVVHGAKVLEEAIAVETFSPVREDYLP
ncbi:cupin domain-containing protein [candidate division KSB3 bacterium]|uniref:Cupin domain-containing protein n=1 Tax=candidate division KSB3 bacterium TaxID=2044937 RepID=A0A9D5JRZ3_9BACT|nr:cupin domain-containing protein [candidate division KSB3 bacterium]MBD3323035.1 cupin domain-containing protein [candidate division KSB3 bacterium]